MKNQEKMNKEVSMIENKPNLDVIHEIITVKSVDKVDIHDDGCDKFIDTLHEGEFYTNFKFYSATQSGLKVRSTYNIFYYTDGDRNVITDIVNVNDVQSLNKCCMLNTRYHSVNGIMWKPKGDGTFIRVIIEEKE